MKTIDHRILIPGPPDTVWRIVSNIENNPHWQVDCARVHYLTSTRQGPGTRWRSTSRSGREYVIQVTAWYEGYGYEYVIVDGASYVQNRGRIRLQEIPEGTIVEWTFSYELGGVLSGVRNALSVRRRIDRSIAEDLRTLYTYLRNTRAEDATTHQAKSLMRDAPDAEQRSAYRPRHPSQVEERFTPPPGEMERVPTIAEAEPPIDEDEDTRPRPALRQTDELPLREPDFLAGLPDAPETPAPAPQPKAEPAPEAQTPPVEPAAAAPPPPAPAAAPAPVPEPEAEPATVEPVQFPGMPPIPEPSKLDTGAVSVFEVFGLPKPSETQQMRAIQAEEAARAAAATPEADPPAARATQESARPPRMGLRILLRRKKRRLRF